MFLLLFLQLSPFARHWLCFVTLEHFTRNYRHSIDCPPVTPASCRDEMKEEYCMEKKKEKEGVGCLIAAWESSFWNLPTPHHHAPFSWRATEIGALCENTIRAFQVHMMSRGIQSKKGGGSGWKAKRKKRKSGERRDRYGMKGGIGGTERI